MKIKLIIVLLLAGVLSTYSALANEEGDDIGKADIAFTSLEELGYTNGYLFEGVSGSNGHTMYFPSPRATEIKSGVLNIDYIASSKLNENSILRVDVNGQPIHLKALDRSGDKIKLTVPIEADALRSNEPIRIALRSSLIASDDRCLDTRLAANFLHVLPTTALQLSLESIKNSVASTYELLPKKVTISLQKDISPELYKSALVLSHHLAKQGKQVSFVDLPQIGDILIASNSHIHDALEGVYVDSNGEPMRFTQLDQKANLISLKLPDRTVLVNSEPLENLPANFGSGQWARLAVGPHYSVNEIDYKSAYAGDSQYISLDERSMDLSTHYFTDKTEWNLATSALGVPANRLLSRLQLNLISTPNNGDLTTFLHVYLNSKLQEVVTLGNDGKSKAVSIALAKQDLYPVKNYIQIVAQRPFEEGDCKSNKDSYPIQIAKGSYVETIARADVEPAYFKDMPAYFAEGLTLFLPEAVLQNPGQSLSFIGNMIALNELPLTKINISYVKKDSSIQAASPFLYFGSAGMGFSEVGVHFDQGHVKIVDYAGKGLLDVDQLPNILTTQVVQSGEFYGVWIRPVEGSTIGLSKPTLLQGRNNVNFSDNKGTLLTLNTRNPSLSEVEYKDFETWGDWFDRYRFWLAALAWIVLTVLFVAIYLMLRRHNVTTK